MKLLEMSKRVMVLKSKLSIQVVKSLVVQLGGFFCFVLANWFLFCTIEETYTGCPKTTGYKIQSRP
jgi:hypothetical protein